MGSFTEVFGGNNIAPAGPTYLSLVPMDADVTLEWPVEEAITDLVVANIIDVEPSVPGLAIHLPSAEESSTGYVALFNNIGANNVNVEASDGSVIVSVAPGTVWQIYLVDNTTPAGSWRVFQFGASVSTAVAAALAGSGLTAKGTQLATNWVIVPQGGDYVIVDADRAKTEQYTGGVGTFTLPQPTTVGQGWYVVVKNQGSGNLTLQSPDGVVTIDGQTSTVFAPGTSGLVLTDGNNFFTIFRGGGSGGGSGFSYIVINAAGSGNITLAGAQLNQIGYRFTGVLTGNRTITVPNTAQEYWVDNETTGAFTFTVGTAAQLAGSGGVIVPQGNQKILQCDGTNVLPGDSTNVSFPISVANGGTGATTAAAARTNLGATTIGNALFTAASAAAAQAAISAVPTSRQILTGTGLLGGGDLSADRTLTTDTGGNLPGYRNIPINNQAGNYNFALTDDGAAVRHPNGSGAGHTYTMQPNATVAHPVGTIITVLNRDSNAITIAQGAGVTFTVVGSTGLTGNRTLAQNGVMTLWQDAVDSWMVSGLGVG